MSTVEDKLRKVIACAYAYSPALRQRFEAAGLGPDEVQTVADLQRVPILPKDDVIALQQADPPFGGMLGVAPGDVRHIFLSPGPIYEPDAGDDDSRLETAQLALSRSGFVAGDVVLNTLSYHLVPAGLMLDRALVRLGCTVVPGGVGNRDLQLKIMRDVGVNAYVGTPSFLLALIAAAEESGADFTGDYQLGKAFVTAEPFSPSMRQTLAGYGIAVGNAYATAELGVLALNTTADLTMQLLPEPIVEVVDPDNGQVVGPGEVGEVVVTTFNCAYPLIRLGTGDMAVNGDPRPGESRQEERTLVLVGRSGEAVKVRGMFVHPNQLRFAAAQVMPVAAIQGVVTRPAHRDFFRVRVALDAVPDDAEAVRQALQQAIQQVARVRVDEVELVDQGAIAADARGMIDERTWE
jgi:phenylacetate-CoA ligase